MASFTLKRRAAGILLHPTSLPGAHGCGDLGPEARRFVDFLQGAGQHWWQMLPINPVGGGNAPYDSPSAFAGNPLLISLDDLQREGLLQPADCKPNRPLAQHKVAFPATIRHRSKALRKAAACFLQDGNRRQHTAFERWCEQHAEWLEPFALFMGLKKKLRNRSWHEWPAELAQGKASALREARRELSKDLQATRVIQYLFDRQWSQLRQYAAERQVGLIGDVPIFVSYDSADVWAHRKLFQLDPKGRPKVVSGCPPDSFSKTGQLWGHPLFNWKQHEKDNFRWWVARIAAVADRFDATRIDHFIGFHNCWAVPGKAKTARNGKWTLSPGKALFTALRKALGSRIEIVAEDLGAVTPEVEALRDGFGFPGMRIMQNGFGGWSHYDEPHRWPPHSVAYTGTHDNDTTRGWFNKLPKGGRKQRGGDGLLQRHRVQRYVNNRTERELVPDMIRYLYASPSNTVIVPLQDVLNLGTEARMNVPGTPTGNWTWRYRARDLRDTHRKQLAELSAAYERQVG